MVKKRISFHWNNKKMMMLDFQPSALVYTFQIAPLQIANKNNYWMFHLVTESNCF